MEQSTKLKSNLLTLISYFSKLSKRHLRPFRSQPFMYVYLLDSTEAPPIIS